MKVGLSVSINSLGKAAVTKKDLGKILSRILAGFMPQKEILFNLDLQIVIYFCSWSIIIHQIFTNNYLVNIDRLFKSFIWALS